MYALLVYALLVYALLVYALLVYTLLVYALLVYALLLCIPLVYKSCSAVGYHNIIALPLIVSSSFVDSSHIDGKDRGNVGFKFGSLKDCFEMRSDKGTTRTKEKL